MTTDTLRTPAIRRCLLLSGSLQMSIGLGHNVLGTLILIRPAFVTPLVTFFMIHARRTAEAAQEVMGAFAGILCSDRLASFDFWVNGRRQTCWAHYPEGAVICVSSKWPA